MTATSTSAPVLELDGASVGYEGRSVVDAIDLRVDAGEVVALMGPNGSGKSTLVRGILGLATVQGGAIRLFGEDRERFSDWRRLGYVPQQVPATSGIPASVAEVVATGRLGRRGPFRRFRAEDRAAVAEAISAVGLADKARAPLATLSGGQQRRATIARALASAPELLVLDEPTAGVDAENQAALADILRDLAAQGTTIVLITHELGPAAPVVTRSVVLAGGRVAYDGPGATAPSEHDDEWHHHHGHEATHPHRPAGDRLGLEGPA
ncbi:MAG: metal ABC transporter ATP-binding protein [Acidimicrobiales bacterium]